MSTKELSEAARAALRLAHQTGGYLVAGTTVLGGRVLRTNAGTLRALAARGLATLCLSPDGGMAARLTAAGVAECERVERRGTGGAS